MSVIYHIIFMCHVSHPDYQMRVPRQCLATSYSVEMVWLALRREEMARWLREERGWWLALRRKEVSEMA